MARSGIRPSQDPAQFPDPGAAEDVYSSPDISRASQSEELFLVGFVVANIVGLRYYTGTIRGRELVGLVREPLNTFDPNAIKVVNTRTHQIGHVERSVAAVLSPLIDSGCITVEGIVPKPAHRNSQKLPCQIYVFATFDSTDFVRTFIADQGMQVISESEPAFALSDAVIAKEMHPAEDFQRFDQIFASVDADANNKRRIVEPPKEIISSELFLHQKEALAWLIQRENSYELPPFWELRKDGSYLNVLTNFLTTDRPKPLQGGIFADEMGLGKTLTLLSLIAANRPGSAVPSFVEINDDTIEHRIGKLENLGEDVLCKSKRPLMEESGKAVKASLKKRRIDDGDGELGPRTTLIICPPSVLSSWITQLDEHTSSGSLKSYLYYGERTADADELRSFDIVLTTYNTLSVERNVLESPIKKTEWWRIILDEAHSIRNVSAQQSKAVIELKGERRWAVTGTPIQNGSFDLYSLMAFLKFQPFCVKSFWNRLVQRPLNQGTGSGLARLQGLMRAISLRRTKDYQIGNKSLVGLPPKIVETCSVDLSTTERQQYNCLEEDSKTAVNELILSDSVLRNYSTVLHIILRLRQICNCMALCPQDINSLFPSHKVEDVSNNPALLTKMVSLLQDGDDLDCPVCLSPPAETIITSCAHIFCRSCIIKSLKHLHPRCPICRNHLSKSDLFSAPAQPSNDDNPTSPVESVYSSKVIALLEMLKSCRKDDPSIKSVIFSQFRKMLMLLEQPLKDAGFSILRLDGSMTAIKRSQVIKKFGQSGPNSPTVLLASLKAACAGINLTAASTVYILEPWWNPGVEEQAMDRVHRIGQKKAVKVVRLIVKDSIEERILELQERKKDLARGAFGKGGRKEMKEMRVEELRAMMNL